MFSSIFGAKTGCFLTIFFFFQPIYEQIFVDFRRGNSPARFTREILLIL